MTAFMTLYGLILDLILTITIILLLTYFLNYCTMYYRYITID